LLAMIDADGTTRYAHSDEQGSVVALTDTNGAVLFTASYGPYGEPWGTTGTNATPFGWLGGHGVFHVDGHSLYLTRHRAYDTTLKRFLSQDPIGLGGGANLYGYANGNPLSYIDPLGLSWVNVLGGIRMVGGVLEFSAGYAFAGASIAFGTVTSPTVIGGVVGAAGATGGTLVGAHGLDTLQAGYRQMISGEHVDTFTSERIQDQGVSRQNANLVDAGIGMAGSMGAGFGTRALSAINIAAKYPLETAGMNSAEILDRWETGSRALTDYDFKILGGTSTSPLFKAASIEQGVNLVGETMATAQRPFGPLLSSYLSASLWYTGLTPNAASGAGILSAASYGLSAASNGNK